MTDDQTIQQAVRDINQKYRGAGWWIAFYTKPEEWWETFKEEFPKLNTDALMNELLLQCALFLKQPPKALVNGKLPFLWN